jgi:hypothetical protein
MGSELVNILLGLTVGLATGFFFERRATQSARREAARLAHQLTSLRESLYTVAAASPRAVPTTVEHPLDEDTVHNWLGSHQNGAGRVSEHRLLDHFIQQGYSAAGVTDIISDLERSGKVRVFDKWIELT